MFVPYDFLALGAALCWACSTISSVSPSRHLGAFAFTRWRMFLVALMLWFIVGIRGTWHFLTLPLCEAMALSGLIGIFIGDTALFEAMNRLGPRRAGVLFATHAVFSVLLGCFLLHETINHRAIIGIGLTSLGVMTAIILGRRKEEQHAWESDHGSFSLGIGLGLLAALCQALGTFIAKPAMESRMDPVAASAIRVTVAAAAHGILLAFKLPLAFSYQRMTLKVLMQTAFNGFLSMGLGMTLLLLALRYGNISIVSVLSAITPVLVLPILWLQLKRPPAPGAWIGAALTVTGTALILLR